MSQTMNIRDKPIITYIAFVVLCGLLAVYHSETWQRIEALEARVRAARTDLDLARSRALEERRAHDVMMRRLATTEDTCKTTVRLQLLHGEWLQEQGQLMECWIYGLQRDGVRPQCIYPLIRHPAQPPTDGGVR